MNLKKILTGGLLGLVGFTAVYAIIIPNIEGLSAITSINNSTYSVMVQEGTGQNKILVSNLLSGVATGENVRYKTGTNIYNTNTGNVGIGITLPTYALDVSTVLGQGLRVERAGMAVLRTVHGGTDLALGNDKAGGALGLFSSGSAGVPQLNITAAGNVGVGTAAPGGKLEVQSTSSRYTRVSANGTLLVNYADSTGQINALTLQNPFSNINVSTNLLFRGGDTANLYDSTKITDQGENLRTASASTRNSSLGFWTSLAGSMTEKMRITSSGYVGIGTTTPVATLQVSGTSIIGNTLGSMSTTNGFTTRAGSGLARDDLNIVLLDTDAAAQKPALTVLNGSTIKGRCFDGGSQMQEEFGSVEIAHGVYLGTGAEFEIHAHWMGNTTSATTTGVWYMEYSKLSLGGVMGSSSVVSGAYRGITGRQYRLDDIATTDISLSGFNIGDTIVFRIYRDPIGADTYAGNMCLIQVGFHTRFDSIGSRTEYTK